jgi:phosphoglycerate kinase
MAIKYIDDIDVNGKKVFIRADFNVPLDENQNITNDNRITATIPTIKYVLDNGGAVICASHLGRPKGKPVKEMSLKPVADRLSELLGVEIKFVNDCISDEAIEAAKALKPGEVLLLENLRFYDQETKNDADFAARLGASADVFISDAFAVSHRAHASVEAITKVVPICAAGFLMKKEIQSFENVMTNPKRPLAAIIGGAKVSGKLEVLVNLIQKVDCIIVGGGMAFTFLKALGKEVGTSLVEEDLIDTAKAVMKKAEEKGVKLLLPVDFVVAEEFKGGVPTQTVSADCIPSGWMGLDIGPETVELFKQAIKDAKTVVWNGPMGVFEIDEFSQGTYAVSDCIAGADCTSIVGGGDSVSALKKSGNQDKVSFVSTAGGAFMELMEGKTLPGIAALDK